VIPQGLPAAIRNQRLHTLSKEIPMRFIRFWSTLLGGALVVGTVSAAPASSPELTVRQFMEVVRSGRDPDAAPSYFAPVVQAHQVTSEGETTVARTPAVYAEHVRGFKDAFGDYRFDIEELIAQGDRVYVRWRQQGRHRGSILGEAPTGATLTEIGSAVYRVVDGRIVEYWIQLDRKGLEVQLERATIGGSSPTPKRTP
jgi:predicted ester cyclase